MRSVINIIFNSNHHQEDLTFKQRKILMETIENKKLIVKAFKWKPSEIKNLAITIDNKIFNQRLAELAKIFYDAFCELYFTFSVEPANTIDSCFEQDQKKAGSHGY